MGTFGVKEMQGKDISDLKSKNGDGIHPCPMMVVTENYYSMRLTLHQLWIIDLGVLGTIMTRTHLHRPLIYAARKKLRVERYWNYFAEAGYYYESTAKNTT